MWPVISTVVETGGLAKVLGITWYELSVIYSYTCTHTVKVEILEMVKIVSFSALTLLV